MIISVTGAASSLKISPALSRAFCEGLLSGARASNALVFTGATSEGVMRLVGDAFGVRHTQSHGTPMGPRWDPPHWDPTQCRTPPEPDGTPRWQVPGANPTPLVGFLSWNKLLVI